MEFVLPICSTPVVQALSNYGDFFSILPCCANYQNWIMSHYANVVYRHPSERKYEFSFCDPIYDQCELIDYDAHHLSEVLSTDNGIDKLKELITNGYYLIVEMNQYHNPSSLWYQKEHYVHRQLLYGFSDDRNCFQSIGYNRTMHYAPAPLPYDIMIGSMFNEQGVIGAPIHSIKPNRHEYQYDREAICKSFRHYIDSTFDGIPEHDDYQFGFNAMEKMHELLDACKQWKFYDMRPVSLFYEHKKLQYEKLKLMQEYEVQISSADFALANEIKNDSQQLLFLYLKIGMSRRIVSMDRIHYLLEEIQSKERQLYPQLLEKLR